MYCPKCGADNPNEAKFCGVCSAAMPGAPPVSQPTYQPPAPASFLPGAVSQGLKIGIGVASVLLPIVGLIMGIIYMVDANPEKKAAGKLWLILACGGMALYCLASLASMSSLQ